MNFRFNPKRPARAVDIDLTEGELQRTLDGLVQEAAAPRQSDKPVSGPYDVRVVGYDSIRHELVAVSDRWSGKRNIDPFVTRALSLDASRKDLCAMLVGHRFRMEANTLYAHGAYLPSSFESIA